MLRCRGTCAAEIPGFARRGSPLKPEVHGGRVAREDLQHTFRLFALNFSEPSGPGLLSNLVFWQTTVLWGAIYQQAPAGRQKYLLPFRSLCVYVWVCGCVGVCACVLYSQVVDVLSVFDIVSAAGVLFSGATRWTVRSRDMYVWHCVAPRCI